MATRRNYTTIGYQGENRWDTITISIADLVKKYPGGYAYLYVVRAGDDEGYIPRNVEQTENALLWTPDDYDTEYDGILKAQAMYVVNGDVVGKTQIFIFNIDQSLTSFATRPATYEDWVNGLLQAATNVNSEIDVAEATLDGAVEAARAAQAAAEAAQTAAESAQHTAENAKASAVMSSNAAYNYAADANRAKRDATTAKDNAVQAKGDAELAKTAAETAEDNANTSALQSEGYAVGTQDGVPAGEGEPYFHDNAKYYKELAEAAKVDAIAAKERAEEVVDGIEDAGDEQVERVTQTGSAQVQSVTAEGTTQVGNVQTKGQQVLASIPADYTDLSENVDDLKSTLTAYEGGTTGQVLRKKSNADNDVEWSDVGAPTDAQVQDAVDGYLDAHPEQTTTVVDGSLTLEKFVLGANGYVTPQQFGAKGDGVTDDKDAIQNAVDYAVHNGCVLFFPAGTYIISNVIQIGNITASGQGLTMIGSGIGKTIIKEKDGTTAAGGRYQKMFYCYMYDLAVRSFDFGSYVISGITFDKNGRSNGNTPMGYQWEGAHIICFQGDNTNTIKSIVIEQCEFVDKIGCCIAIGPSTTKADLISVRDIISVNHPTMSAGIVAQKGDIEIAIDSELTVIERVNVLYSQIERTDAYDADRLCRTKISNSVFGSLEYHYTKFSLTAPKSNIYLDIVDTTCTHKLHVGGIHTQVVNSTFRCPEAFSCPDMKVSNCTILLPYRETTNETTGVTTGTVSPFYGFISNTIPDCYYSITGCNLKIDADEMNADTYTGQAFLSVIRPKDSQQVHFTINDCWFDDRLPSIVSAYSYGGDYCFSNCNFGKRSGSTPAIIAGSYSSYWSRLIIIDCDFSRVADKLCLQVLTGNASSDYVLEIHGDYDGNQWSQRTNNAANVLPDKYTIHPRFHLPSAPSSANLVVGFVGDIVLNTTPTAGGNIGWVCTSPGAVGTWKAFGEIAS